MKTIRINEVDVKRGIADTDTRQVKLDVGMVFEITGYDNLNGRYVVTVQKRTTCEECPFSVPSSFNGHTFKKCGLLKRSRSGYVYPFCAKDLRSSPQGRNAFTINRLDDVLESI